MVGSSCFFTNKVKDLLENNHYLSFGGKKWRITIKTKARNKNRQGWGIILFTTLLVTFVVMGLYSMMQGGSASEISYDKFLKLVDNGKVESVTFTNSRINIVLTDDARKEKAEGKLTEVKDNEKASADQSDSSDSKESEDQENVMDSLLGQISQMQGSSKSKEPDYYTGNVSDDTLVKRLDKAGVEFKSQIPDTASSLIMDILHHSDPSDRTSCIHV